MSNSISFIGRLADDAKFEQVGSSNALKIRVANNVGFGDRQTTNWFKCTMWGDRGEKIQQYLTKGKQVVIHGELTLQEWETKEGQKRITPEVRISSLDLVAGESSEKREEPAQASKKEAPKAEESPEDLPF